MEMPSITSDTLYYQEYCSNYTWWECLEWITILWVWKEELKQIWVEILTTPLVFGSVLLILVWLVKWVLKLILPTKWRI